MITKNEIIDYIQKNNVEKIKEYKGQVFKYFTDWFESHRKATLSEAIATFENAFPIFCKKVKDNIYDPERSAPETYLIGIGKKCLLKIRVPKQKKIKPGKTPLTENIADQHNTTEATISSDHAKHQLTLLSKHLPQHCIPLLMARIGDNKSIDEIMKENGYKNKVTTRNAINKCKSCAKKLGTIMRKKWGE